MINVEKRSAQDEPQKCPSPCLPQPMVPDHRPQTWDSWWYQFPVRYTLYRVADVKLHRDEEIANLMKFEKNGENRELESEFLDVLRCSKATQPLNQPTGPV